MTRKQRRALFIVITDHPGGAERVTFNLASALAARPGWAVEVMIACSSVPDSFSRRVLPPGIRVRYGPIRNWFLAFPLLPLRLLFGRYDLVFTSQIYTNALVSLMRRAGLIRAGRLVMRESMSLFDRFSGPKTWLFAALYRCYGGEDLLIAQTGYMADHVRRRLPRNAAARLRTFANPVDIRSIEEGIAEQLEPALREALAGRPNILFCGRFVDFKRPGLALEAFHLLRRGGDTEARLVFLGTGPLEAGIRRRAEELGMAGDVLFLGRRANPFPIMAMCRYGLLTSANEGFPNVVLEMMACGMRGIVVTPCAGDLDRVPGVTVTPTHDATDIADALGSVLRSRDDFASRYRAEARARSTERYLDRLLGPDPTVG